MEKKKFLLKKTVLLQAASGRCTYEDMCFHKYMALYLWYLYLIIGFKHNVLTC